MVTTPTAYSPNQRAIGVFENFQNAEKALHELETAGFDMNRVSVIAQDTPAKSDMAGANIQDEQIGNKANEGAATGAIAGGALGSITGLLAGLGELAIPGISLLLLAGEATAVASTLAGGTMGAAAGGLSGILVGLGIPKERAKVYSDRVLRGYYLLRVNGTPNEIARAETILQNRGIEEWGI
ncbi:general stress protein [Allocoleopsis franciscana]|uniref:General stress protein 17M-like domain-containing protein n=1 Tax=Allocoleopsis franciscana PCC 7113 TaxID=1173027 RepID=K9WMU3_9CYAN|nr:general stress protein [Allocoleopsis franciscana]AFZ21518.1 hypothetical protein Mic7113_5914 [Allocoleopsis franciscana PCC 7113]